MLHIVADTNVYISALNFGGTADRVLALGRRRRVQVFVSPAILDEVEGVLRHKFEWSSAEAREARTAIQAFARTVHPKLQLDITKEDEADNRILECAVAAKASAIVTGDAHLRALKSFRGILILSPAEFLRSVVELERP